MRGRGRTRGSSVESFHGEMIASDGFRSAVYTFREGGPDRPFGMTGWARDSIVGWVFWPDDTALAYEDPWFVLKEDLFFPDDSDR